MNDEFDNIEEELRKEKREQISEDDLSSSFVARQIVQEIMNFGVNQAQIKKIIQILCLELEDRDLMQKMSNIMDNNLGECDDSHNNKALELVTEI